MRQQRFKKSAAQSVSLPLETLERLHRVSYELQIPKSAIIKGALDRELPRYEAQIAKAAANAPPAETAAASETELARSRP